MREILFRGKRTDNGEWVEGYLVNMTWYLDESAHTVIIPTDVMFYPRCEINSWEEVDPKTVGQFTGSLDKNGKKIFEGDVVKTKFGRLCTVVWFSSQVCNGWDLMPICTRSNLAYTKPPTATDLYASDNLEIIGNIHDNPELLKGE